MAANNEFWNDPINGRWYDNNNEDLSHKDYSNNDNSTGNNRDISGPNTDISGNNTDNSGNNRDNSGNNRDNRGNGNNRDNNTYNYAPPQMQPQPQQQQQQQANVPENQPNAQQQHGDDEKVYDGGVVNQSSNNGENRPQDRQGSKAGCGAANSTCKEVTLQLEGFGSYLKDLGLAKVQKCCENVLKTNERLHPLHIHVSSCVVAENSGGIELCISSRVCDLGSLNIKALTTHTDMAIKKALESVSYFN